MMNHISGIILFLLITSAITLTGQRGITPAKGAESLSLGGSVSGSLGIESLLNNQAGLSQLEGFGVIVSTEQRFLLSELVIASAGVAYNFKKVGTLGLMVSNFGFEEYREQKYGLAYGRKLFENLSIGGQFDVLNTRIVGFGSSTSITFELGLQAALSEAFSIGAHVFSPGTVSINDTNELPSRFNLGVQYQPSDQIYATVEVEKLIDRGLSVQGGISYQIIESLYLRVGTSTNPTRMSFGLAYGFNETFRFDAAMTNHEILGITPAASVRYQSK